RPIDVVSDRLRGDRSQERPQLLAFQRRTFNVADQPADAQLWGRLRLEVDRRRPLIDAEFEQLLEVHGPYSRLVMPRFPPGILRIGRGGTDSGERGKARRGRSRRACRWRPGPPR